MDKNNRNDNLEELLWKNLELTDFNDEHNDADISNEKSTQSGRSQESYRAADSSQGSDRSKISDSQKSSNYKSYKRTSDSQKSASYKKASDSQKSANEKRTSDSQKSSKYKKASDSQKSSNSKKASAAKKSSSSKKSSKKKASSPFKKAATLTNNLLKGSSSVIKGSISTTGTVAKSIFRLITLGLILLTMLILGITFWNQHSALGSLNSMIDESNYGLAGYLGVAVLLLLFELLAFWRASTSIKVLDDGHMFRYDSGRGLFSFPIIYIGALCAGHYGSMIPELHPALAGVKSALATYASLHKELLTIAILGVICCLIRWVCSKLVIAARHSQ